MICIILFQDAQDADPSIREHHMGAHLAFLETHADQIDAAGPLSDPEGLGRDGLWVVDVPDVAAAERLVRADPFWPTGLWGGYAILPWRRVFRNGAPVVP